MDANKQDSSSPHSSSTVVNGKSRENEKTKKIYKSNESYHQSDEFERQIEESLEDIDGHVVIDSDSDFEDNHFSDWSRNSKVKSQFSSPESLSDDELAMDTKGPLTPEAVNIKIAFPPILPFVPKRRLSECKEEEEEDQFTPPKNSFTSKEVAGTTRKFIVTKTEHIATIPEVIVTDPQSSSQPHARPEAKNLRNMTAKMNSQTIHFPCSTPSRAAIQNIFSQVSGKMTPHLDSRFFDSSMVEIRQSTNSVDKVDGDSVSSSNNDIGPEQKANLDEVWIKRAEPEVKVVSYFKNQLEFNIEIFKRIFSEYFIKALII